jgi:hypothetical protein
MDLEKKLKEDFRYFLTLLWKEMNLPRPTKMQLLFADALQKSDDRKLCMLGYRGFAKTYISCAFLMWNLYKNPKLQVAIWAANQENAVDSTQLMLNWLKQVPWLKHLHPGPNQDQSKTSFDVAGRGQFRGSSVTAYGITGTVTGTRADLLLVDDPETSSNGDTAKRRIQIDRAINEASYVVKAADETNLTRIIILGTVHFDDSLYVRLLGQGYRMFLFPMAVPSEDTQKMCWPYYLEPIRRMMRPKSDGGEGLVEGTPLDRFGLDEIELRKGTGLLNYERQCLVNPFRTSLSEKPFDMKKAIIFDADPERLPTRFYHQQDDRYLDNDLMGYSSASLTDKLYRPYKWDEQMVPYARKVMWVDPAGLKISKKADETAFGVLGVAGGYAVLFHVEGLVGGSRDENLLRILEVARRYKVDCIYVEGNFGLGMFAAQLRAKQMREYGRFGMKRDNIIPIEDRFTNQGKGRKIVAAIDPVLNRGRLIITPECIRTDYETANVHSGDDKMCFRLTYQLSYGNEALAKLEHDDRLEILACLLEECRGHLTTDAEDNADDWDQWLVAQAFAQDEIQFIPGQGLQPLFNPRSFRETRRSFV